jgi:hypothetical protein
MEIRDQNLELHKNTIHFNSEYLSPHLLHTITVM